MGSGVLHACILRLAGGRGAGAGGAGARPRAKMPCMSVSIRRTHYPGQPPHRRTRSFPALVTLPLCVQCPCPYVPSFPSGCTPHAGIQPRCFTWALPTARPATLASRACSGSSPSPAGMRTSECLIQSQYLSSGCKSVDCTVGVDCASTKVGYRVAPCDPGGCCKPMLTGPWFNTHGQVRQLSGQLITINTTSVG